MKKEKAIIVSGDDEIGRCPKCGKCALEYGTEGIDEDRYYFSWICENCGAAGKEWYQMDFVEHTLD